jgi:hypothetical protein
VSTIVHERRAGPWEPRRSRSPTSCTTGSTPSSAAASSRAVLPTAATCASSRHGPGHRRGRPGHPRSPSRATGLVATPATPPWGLVLEDAPRACTTNAAGDGIVLGDIGNLTSSAALAVELVGRPQRGCSGVPGSRRHPRRASPCPGALAVLGQDRHDGPARPGGEQPAHRPSRQGQRRPLGTATCRGRPSPELRRGLPVPASRVLYGLLHGNHPYRGPAFPQGTDLRHSCPAASAEVK